MSTAGWGGPTSGGVTVLGNQRFGRGDTPSFTILPDGSTQGDLDSGQAPHLGEYNEDRGRQVSQPGETEATEGPSEKKPKVSLFNGLIITR